MRRGILILFLLVSVSANAQNNPVKTGLWELSVTTSITGMKSNLPPQTIKQCITEKNMVPRDMSKDGCKVSDVKVNSGTVSWKMACTNKMGNIKGAGKLTYSGTTMQGESNLIMSQNGKAMNMQQRYSGKYVGKCK